MPSASATTPRSSSRSAAPSTSSPPTASIEDVHFRRAWTAPQRDRPQGGRRQPERSRRDGRDAARDPAQPGPPADACRSPTSTTLIDGVVARRRGARARRSSAATSRDRPARSSSTSRPSAPLAPRGVLTRARRPAGRLSSTSPASVGGAAAGLGLLAGRRATAARSTQASARVRRAATSDPSARWRVRSSHRRQPAPRRPAIDLSDGLADARRLASPRRAACAAILRRTACRSPRCARRGPNGLAVRPVRVALAGGEDYELLFAVPPRRRNAFLSRDAPLSAGLPVTPRRPASTKRALAPGLDSRRRSRAAAQPASPTSRSTA